MAKALKEAEQKRKQEAEQKEAEAKKLAEQKKQEEEQAKRKAIIEEKTQKLNQELDQFSVTLNKKHFNNAVLMQNELKEQGYGEIPIHVHSSDVYKKSFTFPQIAHNDFAVEQLESLSIAEQNLDKDPTNDTVMENFLKTADEVAHNLSERYKEQWVDPKDDRNQKLSDLNEI